MIRLLIIGSLLLISGCGLFAKPSQFGEAPQVVFEAYDCENIYTYKKVYCNDEKDLKEAKEFFNQ